MSPSRGPGLSAITARLRSALDNADWQFLGEAPHPDRMLSNAAAAAASSVAAPG